MVWQSSGRKATLRTAEVVGEFAFDQPAQGLRGLTFVQGGLAIENAFGIRITDRPSVDMPLETYIREADLVVRYPPRASDLVSHEVYYRVLGEPVGIEMILSAQTTLLESHPETEVRSAGFGPGELLVKLSHQSECHRVARDGWVSSAAQPEFFLFRRYQAPVSLVYFVHPGDFYEASAQAGTETSLTFRVFPESLEKGVIRRARFQLRILPRVHDVDQATVLYEQAIGSTPPLTT